MKPNGALCFVLAGLALWLIQLRGGEMRKTRMARVAAARVLAVSLGMVGLLTIAEYFAHLNLGVDKLLLAKISVADAGSYPGRMGAVTALGFFLLGSAILLATTRKTYAAQGLALLTCLIGWFGCVGYLLGIKALVDVAHYSSMALHSAVLFLVMGLAILSARPAAGFMRPVTSAYLGGVMVRRVLPMTVVLVTLLGWLLWHGQLLGLFGAQFGIAFLIMGEIVIFVVLLWTSALQLNHLDRDSHLAQSQENLLAAIVDSSEDAIFTKDLSGIIVSWNQGAERLYGYSAGEIVGKSVATLVPDGLQEEANRFLRQIALDRVITSQETLRRRKDGSVVPVSLVISPVRGPEGRIVGASTVARDISKRKEQEAELRESEERLRLFIERAPAALAMFDRQMRYLYASHRWRADYGLGDRDLYGISHYEIFPEIPTRWKEAHRIGLAGEVLQVESDCFDREDGSRQWIKWEIRPWHDRTGGVGGILIFTEDITARKKVEDELARSRKALEDKTILLQSVLDSMSEGLVAADEHGKFIVWNPAAERIVGLGAADIPSQAWTQHYGLYLPDRVTPFPPEFNPLARAIQGEAGTAVMFLRHPYLTAGVFVEAYASPLRDKQGSVRGGVTAFRDITERMTAEEKLREYERVVEGLEEMILVVDRKYRYVIANRSFLNFRGMSSEQVVGHTAEEVVGSEVFLTQVKEKMDECFLGKVVRYEMSYNFPNLGKRELSVAYFPINGPAGVDRIACVLHDITERLQGQEALRKSEERFSKAFRNSPLAITISTIADGRYLDVNDAFLSMLGYERHEVIGHTAAELRFWSDLADSLDLLQQLQKEDRVAKQHMQYRTAKGETREAEVWGESIELEGQLCLLAIIRDITEVQQLEAQLRQAQKMEAVGRLAGGVAHDFNNMLSVIIGYSDITLELLATESPVNKNILQIKKASQRAVLLTRQLLTFSRKQVVFPKILDITDVIQNTISMLRRMVSEDIDLEFRPTGPIGSIKADPGQIEQILMNLVVNARDAMPSGGQIIIEATHGELDEHYVLNHPGSRIGQHVVLTVSDTGCGMDENIKSKIFEPFFTTKPAGEGTGLGLATVYGIVKQSDGYIMVYSEPDKGTTFKIYFPRVDQRAESFATSRDEIDPPRGSERILVVEDDPVLRELAARLLRGSGYDVLEAGDSEKALELVKNSKPDVDLLLTDVVMPGKNGAELSSEAKLVHPHLRVLCMSGYTGDLVALRGRLTPEHFLEKPFTRRSLLAKVYSALHSDSQNDGIRR